MAAEGAPAFQVCFTSGAQLRATAMGSVAQLREDIERQHPVEPATYLKLIQGTRVLLDEVPLSELATDAPIMAVVTRETRIDVLLHASAHSKLYKDRLEEAGGRWEAERAAGGSEVSTEFPSILRVLEDMSGEAQELPDLKEEEGRLVFSSAKGGLLLPSLELTPLLAAAKAEVESVTLSVAVNSDAYNQGLGIVVEASPFVQLPEGFSLQKSYFYNGYGLENEGRQRNAVKFHPDMSGGQLRIEGAGGFGNQNVGFTPSGWTSSGRKLHTLAITFRASGENELLFEAGEPERSWKRGFNNVLFDGKRVPALYAWLDLGNAAKPLHVSMPKLTVKLR